RSLPATIAIVEQIKQVPPLIGDAGGLQQVLVNLVTNAAQRSVPVRASLLSVSTSKRRRSISRSLTLGVAWTPRRWSECSSRFSRRRKLVKALDSGSRSCTVSSSGMAEGLPSTAHPERGRGSTCSSLLPLRKSACTRRRDAFVQTTVSAR